MSDAFKPQWFHILLALADQNRHGYGIQRDVLAQTNGEMTLWPAMLYRSLAALTNQHLIEPVDQQAHEPADERRQDYRITKAGRRRLAYEADRLAGWLKAAQERNVFDTAEPR